MRTLISCALLLLLLLLVPVLADDAAPKPPKTENIDVMGVVVDAAGKPVEGAGVAEFWNYDGAWSTEGGVKTDAEGKFSYPLRTFPDYPARWYKLQAGKDKLAAISVLKAADLKTELKFTLQPLTAVTGKFECEEGFSVADGGYINVYTKTGMVWLCSTQAKDAGFTLNLPPGEYTTLMLLGDDFVFARPAIKVEGGEKLALPAIKLEIAPLARFYGKQAPAVHVSYVRNLPADLEGKGADVTLADFKGRWVLIEFWGFW